MSEVLSRIDDIRTQIDQLRSGRASSLLGTAAAASAGSGTSATSAGAFADALASTTGAGATSAADAAGGLATTPSVAAVKGSVATGSGATGADVVSGARKYLGVPYVFGGESASGMDCSGLVQTVFKELGVSMPRVVPDQARMGAEVPSLAEAKPGDLLVAKGEGHIVIYIGDGKVLHAPRPGKDVQIVDNWYKDSDLATIRRVVPATGSAAAASASATSLASLASSLGVTGTGAGAGAGAAGGSGSTDLMTAALQRMMSGGAA
ncbi:C40 family peptidase [Frigoribacterium sp. PvP032]|uniref:C40 family peptidase n=1 Tax=Frigoribacterium sp. PvP032 TaxID=2806589 RepID=UPI001AE651E9|nr:C40 family peptidase [Frigoribacterium sp. PvP032]MBP1191991.1 cell wall-associated NlpC family hydrolase [Frigoribacterium sp. PvP032]